MVGVESLRQRARLSKIQGILFSLGRYALIISISFVILYPLLAKIPSSLMTEADAIDRMVRWIPRELTGDNFRIAFELMNYPVTFKNSLGLTLLVSLLQLTSCTLIGYGLARFDFRGSNLLFGLVIFTLIVPPQMINIPLYLNWRFFDLFGLLSAPLNLIGTHWPFILTSITGTGLRNGFFIYMMRQVFRGMPKDLEDAAYVDGANSFTTFFRIMLPSAGTGLLTVFLFAFVWQWNDIFLSTLYLGGSLEYLPFALEQITNILYEGRRELPVSFQYASTLNNAGMLLFIAPLLVLYAFLQRYFVESIERTGIKG